MRIASVVLLVAVLGCLATAPAHAGTLDSRLFEWAFNANYLNVNGGGGSTTDLQFSWGYLIETGYSELGLTGTYQRVDEGNSGGGTTDTSIVGPFYAWNWTPRSSKGTGFLSVGVGGIGGDLSRAYDYAVDGAIGVKFFVGDSAAVTGRYFFQRFYAGSGGPNAQDFSGVAIGIALYTNRK